MSGTARRDFLAASLGAAAFSRIGGAQTTRRLATDWVTLGKSNVKVTRLAFGTGTNGGRVQRELGQEGFTRLVRHAYDSGIRFFETADTYGGMHDMLGIALKGVDSVTIGFKNTAENPGAGRFKLTTEN
jgi:aryl-alcohol dehydrogenase-like predicted oxidoreductase